MDRFLSLGLSWWYLSTMILGSLAITTCPGFETKSKEAPPLITSVISMSKVNGHALANPNISHPENDTIYINRFAPKAQLNCWAPYPIDLTFHGLLTNINAQVRTSVNSFRSSNGSKIYCYCINVTLGIIDDSVVGKYSCFEVSQPKNKVSKYVYLFSQPKTALLRKDLKTSITKVLWPGQTFISFECAVSDPSVSVNLSKVESDGTMKVFTNEANYDPKVGFTLNLNLTDKMMNPEGEYVCKTPLHQTDSVRFNVIRAPNVTYYPRKRQVRRKVSDGLHLSCSSHEQVFFSLDPKLTKLNPVIRNSSKYEYESTLWVERLIEPTEYKVICKTSNQATIHEWTVSVKETKTVQYQMFNNSFTNNGKPFGLLDLNGFNEDCRENKTSSELILFECNNWVECRLNSCQDDPSKDKFCQSNNRCNGRGCMPNGLIQCPSYATKDKGSTINSIIYFHGITTNNEYSDAGSILKSWKHDILNITAYSSTTLSLKKEPEVLLTCLGTNFVVSAGFEWFAMAKNGSSYELTSSTQITGYTFTIKESYGRTKSSLKSDLYIPRKLLNNPDILNFQCKAPIWNSTNWIDNSISLKNIKDVLDLMGAPENTTSLSSRMEDNSLPFLMAVCVGTAQLFVSFIRGTFL